jgi:hypothetical protein
VAACTVLLAIIGPAWLIAADEHGRGRLDDPDDLVRLEIEAALTRGVRVIPILVEGAAMPTRKDLPESLAGLARLNALLIRHESFRYDTGRLVRAIEQVQTAAVEGATIIVSVDPSLDDTIQQIRIQATEETTVSWFLDHVYFALQTFLTPRTYGRAWTLVNDRGTQLNDMGRAWARERGREKDDRPISAVGIVPGDRLTAVPRPRQAAQKIKKGLIPGSENGDRDIF